MNSRVLSKLNFVFLLVLVMGNAGACASEKLQTTVLSIVREDFESVEITVEIARTEDERAQGLMHRKKLPDGKGMIFVFERDQQLSFWMKNTLIPLSIAFITSDGRIIEIKNMQPHDLNSVQSSRSARYALETPQGWFTRAGIKPGDRVIINF
jgi:uncharacterized membrane protein (UPF0127 family)